jgi:hypothetical protein
MLKTIVCFIFQPPGLFSILSHWKIYPLFGTGSDPTVAIVRIKNPKGLTVRVDIPYLEVNARYKTAIRESVYESAKNEYQYYKAYLRQLVPGSEDNYDNIIAKLKIWKSEIESFMDDPKSKDIYMVKRLIQQNNYICINTKRYGLTVKMFHTQYFEREVFVKTYLYDPNCEFHHYNINEKFKNEIIFQCYAEQLHKYVDFISPKVYSWGRIPKCYFEKNGSEMECLYIIMEYIPFVTLKEANYSAEHMRHIYERVEQIDTELSSHLLHHNDLHDKNIMVYTPSPISDTSPLLDKSPLPVGNKSPLPVGNKSPLPVGDKSPHTEIVILDFGEASLGPKKPLFDTFAHSKCRPKGRHL